MNAPIEECLVGRDVLCPEQSELIQVVPTGLPEEPQYEQILCDSSLATSTAPRQ
jgi:hypothetical protein